MLVRRYSVAVMGNETGHAVPLTFWKFVTRKQAEATIVRLNQECLASDNQTPLTSYVLWDRMLATAV